ncbi:hypothetical protein CDL12_11316 [Handroanthus impetiginosus]|uniref:Uncharacterized protein n=1 Tax=Handroanthus impetiginosus TaxID=429701 RepID=A0A2G9HET3_9LAMI|nr:hypothetical protein CDL12_11316 [Handroanthus impetiginosus]
MAEGLIAIEEKGNNEILRDVAQRYLNELALRCMVQVRGDDISRRKFSTVYNKFTSCRLHDFMWNLCLSKGKGEGKIPSSINSTTANNINNIRRLAILGNSKVFEKYFQSHDLKLKTPPRSLLISPRDDGRMCIGRITNDFKKIKFLKTLKLEKCEFEGSKLPSEVGKLIHLRYLSFFESNVDELPFSVCYLPYLLTLDLRVRRRTTLPNALILDGLKELESCKVV